MFKPPHHRRQPYGLALRRSISPTDALYDILLSYDILTPPNSPTLRYSYPTIFSYPTISLTPQYSIGKISKIYLHTISNMQLGFMKRMQKPGRIQVKDIYLGVTPHNYPLGYLPKATICGCNVEDGNIRTERRRFGSTTSSLHCLCIEFRRSHSRTYL